MAREETITFDDVLIRPARSDIEPSEADTRITLTPSLTLKTPILSSAMDRVTDARFSIALSVCGGLGILHRNCTIKNQCAMVREVKEAGAIVGAACGPFDMERAQALIEAGVDVLVIDCAHGHNTKVVAHTKEMRHAFPHTYIIAGNIATEEAARDLSLHVNAVKVGIGPGSICTTRIVSGVGVPQITAIMEVANGCKETGALVIADGGIRTPGDVAKALAAGAHLVMLGSVLACTHEAPGKTFEREGIPYKEYRGMGSRVVLEERKSDDRYLQKNRAILPEGIEASTRVCGPLADVIEEFTGGLQVAMGYVGARSLDEFRERAKLIRITDAGVRESRPHSVHALG